MVLQSPNNSSSKINSNGDFKLVSRLFIGSITKRGNRIKAFNIFFYSILLLNKVYGVTDPVSFVSQAVNKVRPKVTFVSKKVAGIVYKLPKYIPLRKSTAVSIRWIITSAVSRNSYEKLSQKLAREFIDICSGFSTLSLKKKSDSHNLARANRPFLRYLKRKKK